MRVYVAEAMPSDKVTKAYSLLATSNQLTVLVAPLVGASLYAPLGQKITFFGFTLSSRKFPALLPATGNAMFIFGALLMTLTSVRRVSISPGPRAPSSLCCSQGKAFGRRNLARCLSESYCSRQV